MTTRAKLKLVSKTERVWNVNVAPQVTLRFDCIYDASIPEDRRFQKATPSGHIELQIDNPAALEQFELGIDYYVDFSKA